MLLRWTFVAMMLAIGYSFTTEVVQPIQNAFAKAPASVTTTD